MFFYQVMHESIGELFEQARKHKNLSMKDVADATKIRKDFLEAFENNDFDIPLPDIYKRGFIKNYSNFLGLDTSNVLANYDSVILGGTKKPSKQRLTKSEWMQQLALEVPNHPQENNPQGDKESQHGDQREGISEMLSRLSQQAYFKWLLAGCVLAFVLFIFMIKWMVFPTHSKQLVSETREPYRQQANFAFGQSSAESVILYSTGDVHVVVRQESDKKHIFAGVLHSNTRKVISKSGPVQVLFSDGSLLIIEGSDGKQLKPNQIGRGWVRVQ
jgi:cytoskeleton protein RodZ